MFEDSGDILHTDTDNNCADLVRHLQKESTSLLDRVNIFKWERKKKNVEITSLKTTL